VTQPTEKREAQRLRHRVGVVTGPDEEPRAVWVRRGGFLAPSCCPCLPVSLQHQRQPSTADESSSPTEGCSSLTDGTSSDTDGTSWLTDENDFAADGTSSLTDEIILVTDETSSEADGTSSGTDGTS
jgi:hypothetical protein